MNPKSQIYSRYFTYIKPLTRSPIVKTYGSVIFTLVIITIFILFAIKPTVETILVLQKKLSDTAEVLDKINKKANDLSLGKQNYDNLDAGIKLRISQTIPSGVDLKSITQTLDSFGHMLYISSNEFIFCANKNNEGSPLERGVLPT